MADTQHGFIQPHELIVSRWKPPDLMLLNKCDLLPYLDFDVSLAVENAHRVNPKIQVIRISATSGEGMEEWLEWIRAGCQKAVTEK